MRMAAKKEGQFENENPFADKIQILTVEDLNSIIGCLKIPESKKETFKKAKKVSTEQDTTD